MNYPLISEYVEAIKVAEDNFNELTYLRPVLKDGSLPVMSVGGYSVVFKMQDVRDGKLYAVKCFTKDQEGRAESYKLIADELEFVSSNYMISVKYLEKELFVDTDNSEEDEFPVLLMDWVDGQPLDKYLRQNLYMKKTLEKLLNNFFQLAKWLIDQPFAHGDLKPDNILVKNDGSLVLVDYDGMYVPAMKGQKSREVGSPDFCHPQRNEDIFDEHIDDFSILSILLSLCVCFIKPGYLNKYGTEDRLLFSKNDYIDIQRSNAFRSIPSIIESATNYKLLFENACQDIDFQLKTRSLMPINKLFVAKILNNGGAKEELKKETTSSQRDLLEQEKREKATKWQAALLLHILTMFISFIIVNNEHNKDGIWIAMGWGFGIGLIAWFFAYFDYFKRDGSFGNCLFAFLFYPVTLYYGIYRVICVCLNMFKEWRT